MIHFTTSRVGKIDKIKVYRYDFNRRHLSPDAKESLEGWLKYGSEGQTFHIADNYFLSFKKLEKSKQFKFRKILVLEPPFENIQEISAYLAKDILSNLSPFFTQLFRENSVIVDNIVLGDFILLKCIEFSIKVFSSGRCYVHFFPHTRIVSPDHLDVKYLKMLKGRLNSKSEDVWISIRSHRSHFYRTKNLAEREDYLNLLDFVEKNEHSNLYATFNYRTLAEIDREEFIRAHSYNINILTKELGFLRAVAEGVYSSICAFNLKPFHRYHEKHISIIKNLIVGKGNVVNKQSASFYSGMYKGVPDLKIQPIFINGEGTTRPFNLEHIFQRYNGIHRVCVLPSIAICSDTIDKNFHLPIELKKLDEKTICSVFTNNHIPSIFFKHLALNRIHFEIYSGSIEKYKIDNFVVQCIIKMGGVLSVLKSMHEHKSTYFIGIDLGHGMTESILGLTLFNHQGELLYTHTSRCAKNEVIDPFALKALVAELYEYIVDKKLPLPQKVIIHRDGRINPHEIHRLVDTFMLLFNVVTIDIIEVIKSGHPVMGCYGKENGYMIPPSGTYLLDPEENHAILVTSTQGVRGVKNTIVNPLTLNKVYGRTDFEILIEQIFWLTKVNPFNIYNSSRLPATTMVANDIVRTIN